MALDHHGCHLRIIRGALQALLDAIEYPVGIVEEQKVGFFVAERMQRPVIRAARLLTQAVTLGLVMGLSYSESSQYPILV